MHILLPLNRCALLILYRKHTGERPFQCHCNRRFSRLDNLRQHAQTVHVNEEIPGDSLAATGTRFQRQIRTDRVRPAGSRPRSGTVGSNGSLSRSHSRNLSASSVGSNASTYSNTPEPHRRPPPLIMSNDVSGRPKLGLEPPSTPPAQYRGYSTNSPGGFSTPTSATYSGAPGSPGYGSTMESPMSTTSRGMGFFGPRTPNRRLSVPSGASPFQNSHGTNYPPSYPNPLTPSALNYANQNSVYASPTSSTFSGMRMEPSTVPADDWRRRTWHPSTYTAAGFNYSRPATSGLTYSQTPDAPQPAFAQYATAAAGQAPRLPGIESFDHVQHQPSTPPRRQPSPTRIDPALQAPIFATPNVPYRSHSHTSGHKRGRHSVDTSLNNNLTRLDIHGNQQKETPTWGQQTMTEIQDVAARQVAPDNHDSSTQAAAPVDIPRQAPPAGHEMGQPSTPPKTKRQGWYNGPLTAMRTSPEDSSSSEGVPTPGTSAAEIHPAIMHSNGYIEPHHAVLVADVSIAHQTMPTSS
jgi:C2H2 transcription facotor